MCDHMSYLRFSGDFLPFPTQPFTTDAAAGNRHQHHRQHQPCLNTPLHEPKYSGRYSTSCLLYHALSIHPEPLPMCTFIFALVFYTEDSTRPYQQ